MSVKISTIAKAAASAAIAGAFVLASAIGAAGAAGAASGTMYGDPTAAAQWWRHQEFDDCAIMSMADVVGQVTGKEPSEKAIIKKAQSTPSAVHSGSVYIKPADTKDPNSGMGTNPGDIPTLLAAYGVNAVITDNASAAKTGVATGMEALEHQLGSGHKVIVDLNAEMIWKKPVESKDKNGNPVADHAVVVIGVDTANNVVHLNDSGTKNGRDEQIPLDLFLKAWDTGDDFMAVTT
jgi:Peptidase_C39 like family